MVAEHTCTRLALGEKISTSLSDEKHTARQLHQRKCLAESPFLPFLYLSNRMRTKSEGDREEARQVQVVV
jgi:hypothetical protein